MPGPVPLRTLSIIIPAYNEERTIHLILDKVRDVQLRDGIAKEVVIVASLMPRWMAAPLPILRGCW